jgi:hypothetical protein
MKPSLTAALALLFGLGLQPPAQAAAQAVRAPRYAAAMEAELRQMGIAAECASESALRHRCRASRPAAAGSAGASLHLVYSDESDTIYFYFERYLLLPSDHARAATVLRRLMELNWDLLVGKFEWNPRTGEVRLGATLSTDSNFDRRAFRSVIAALDTLAARYASELRDLIGS